MIKKHNNLFLPKKGVFQMRSNDFVRKNDLALKSTQRQLRRQKRMRMTSNKRKII